MKRDDITVTRHPMDGFTLSAMHDGYLVSRRYVFYSEPDATREFLAEFGGPDCPNALGWITDDWHECDQCR